MTEIAASKEEIEKLLRDNQRAIELARKTREDINRTLRDSERRTERILADLRRAGVLRD
jgi:hypothetical protein